MSTFLNIVAQDILRKYGYDLSDITVVFPNKRAALFMNAEFSTLCEKPLWSPRYITITELFGRCSELEVADRITLICELYKSYTEVTGTTETLDQFYSWGELMLSDFDDIDKHLADAKKIFVLLGNLHELDSTDYLTKDQIAVIRQFFRNFSEEHNSILKRRFINLWSRFHDIYCNYKDRLRERGIAYEGMIYRDAIERLKENGEVSDESLTDGEGPFIFIGFNLLNTAEEELFKHIRQNKGAKFYWDFDKYYMTPNKDGKIPEAGRYISQYMRIFPNELDIENPIYNMLTKKENITFVSASADDLQARYITKWLTKDRIDAGRRTAIVLADEELLETVLHCLPENVEHVNITTGYPLAKSPVASLMRVVMQMLQQKNYSLHYINSVLRHPYMNYMSENIEELHTRLNSHKVFYPNKEDLCVDENLERLFTPLSNMDDCTEINQRLMWLVKEIAMHVEEGNQLTREILFRMYTLLTNLSAQSLQEWSVALYSKLLLQVIQQTSIPFHGEPIEGIQIMGVLETRNLDFDHVLLLSCSEGKMPAKVNDSSFIPHAIRKAHDLTTVDNKVAIYAYYFHRLLQRTKDANVVYKKNTTDGRASEMSRFLLQMLSESPLKIKRIALEPGHDGDNAHTLSSSVRKTEEISRKLIESNYFSPSALGKYMRCQMMYFYRYVVGITDNDDKDTEEVDAPKFGNIFHDAAERFYKPMTGRVVTKEYIERFLNEKGHVSILNFIDQAFREKHFMIKDEKRPTPRLGGLELINRDMILTFMLKLLRYDAERAPFMIMALEEKIEDKVTVNTCMGEKRISFGGYMDRLDCITDKKTGAKTLRIIDYKTGKYPTKDGLDMSDIDAIFDSKNIDKHADYFLQAMMYASIVAKTLPENISTELFYVEQMGKKDYDTHLKINGEPIVKAQQYIPSFMEKMKELIAEIVDTEVPFTCTEITRRCDYCSYKQICKE